MSICSVLIVYALHHIQYPLWGIAISEPPDMDYLTFITLSQNETFHLWGWIKPRIWKEIIACKLAITETLLSTKNNFLRPCVVSPSSIEKGQWLCCKPAWGLQMSPEVLMCHTKQSCGWDIAYKGFGNTWNHPHSGQPPGSTPAQDWNIFRIYSPQTPIGSVETNHKNCCRKTRTALRPSIHTYHVSSDLHCLSDARVRGPTLKRQWRAARFRWVTHCLGWRTRNWEQDFFTGEYRFCLSHGDEPIVRVWHRRGERYHWITVTGPMVQRECDGLE